jgi:hypothetical protein
MATAASLGVPYIAIPDSWLMREQDDPATKEASKLKTELQRLQSQEPRLNIKVLDQCGKEMTRLTARVDSFNPLTAAEVQSLMEEIELQFPMATEFGSAETTPQPRLMPQIGGLRGVTVTEFTPATEADIRTYQHEAYPEWLTACRAQLEDLHLRLNARVEWPEVDIVIANSGTRPATRSLVRFLARGDIEIIPPDLTDNEEDEPRQKGIESVKLPNPPSPPRGVWTRKMNHPASRFAEMMGGRFRDPFAASVHHPTLTLDRLHPPKPRDPDSFYWKDGRPSVAKSLVELTCENWRHGVEDEHFLFRVDAANAESVSGAIQCEVHAENLSDPIVLTLPVRIERTTQSTLEHARTLVSRLGAR